MATPEEDDYESLPATSSVTTHMIAGAAAGVMEHTIMYPIDSVKTRMQSLLPHPKAQYRNITDALIRISGQEGLKSTIRGIRAVVYGAAPAHAMYFACYEKCKKTLSTKGHSNHLVHGFSGCMATILHDAVMNPADVVKQRMQMYGSPFQSCAACVRAVYRAEGIRAFYRSYTTQLSINLPFQALHFMTYELCQDKLNPNRAYDPKTHVVSGGIAGGLAAAATTPLDVCKTLLNTQDSRTVAREGQAIEGMRHAVATIWKYHGLRGFFRGVGARVLYVMPGTAISWSVYEFFKFFMTQREEEAGEGGKGVDGAAKKKSRGASCDGFTAAPAVHVVRAATDLD